MHLHSDAVVRKNIRSFRKLDLKFLIGLELDHFATDDK